MIASIAITDPTSALMLASLGVDEFGAVHPRRTGPHRTSLRRRQRRFQQHARLRKLLA